MCSGGIAGSAGVGNTSDRKASLDAKDTEYLKNIVLQYMTGGDEVCDVNNFSVTSCVLSFTFRTGKEAYGNGYCHCVAFHCR
jgi:hypothetical protein